jgi:predicted 2-oxoglutarate/Fe(II)-dependent dioxygenase YbiX
MELKNFIKIYDNGLQPETISSLIKWLEKQAFEDGLIDVQVLNKKIRDTQVLSFNNFSSGSQTRIHWLNLLGCFFLEGIKKYSLEVSKKTSIIQQIETIDALQYEVGGHYVYHVDSATHIPRTLSAVLFLNNDYEGGELCFADPINQECYLKVSAAPGRLIVWPSNFLYPHAVTPLKKGKRYSVVSWAN